MQQFSPSASDNGKLLATIVQGSGFTQLDQQHQLKCPGIYIAVSPEGEIYVGVGRNLLARTNRFTATPTRPAMLLYITGNTTPLPQESALVIERIVFQAFRSAGLKMFNRYEPAGSPIALGEYAELQADWAAMTRLLPRLCPGLLAPGSIPGIRECRRLIRLMRIMKSASLQRSGGSVLS